MRSLRVHGLVLVCALVAAPRLVAQGDERLARLDAPTRDAVAAQIDSARALGLPVDALVNKALEGASKGADGARIVAAVRSLAQSLAAARTALGPASQDGELVAGSAALRAGVDASLLERLRREHPGRSVLVPLAVMADLVARGVPADTAAAAVLALARAGAREAQLVAFRQSVERDIALGAPAGASASVRVAATGTSFGDAGAIAPTTGGRAVTPRKP